MLCIKGYYANLPPLFAQLEGLAQPHLLAQLKSFAPSFLQRSFNASRNNVLGHSCGAFCILTLICWCFREFLLESQLNCPVHASFSMQPNARPRNFLLLLTIFKVTFNSNAAAIIDCQPPHGVAYRAYQLYGSPRVSPIALEVLHKK